MTEEELKAAHAEHVKCVNDYNKNMRDLANRHSCQITYCPPVLLNYEDFVINVKAQKEKEEEFKRGHLCPDCGKNAFKVSRVYAGTHITCLNCGHEDEWD